MENKPAQSITLDTPQANPPETPPTPQANKISKPLITALVLLFLTTTGIAGYYVYQNYQSKQKNRENQLITRSKLSPTPLVSSPKIANSDAPCDQPLSLKELEESDGGILVSFLINEKDTVDNFEVFYLSGQLDYPSDKDKKGQYCIDYIDKNNNIVYRRPFFVDFSCVVRVEPGGCKPGEVSPFVLRLPFFKETNTILVKHNNIIIVGKSASEIQENPVTNKVGLWEACNPQINNCDTDLECKRYGVTDIYRCTKYLKEGEECGVSVAEICNEGLTCVDTDSKRERCGTFSTEGWQECSTEPFQVCKSI